MDISGALGEYIKQINSNLGIGNCSELTHRKALQVFMENTIPKCEVMEEQKKIDSGKPDFTIIQDKIPIGFVETKDIGIDLGKTESSNQLKRYYEGIGNVIVTDYIEFRLYSKIAEEAANSIPKPVLDPVVIATQDKSGKYKLIPDAPQKLSMLLNAFVENSDKVKPADNPKELTVRLASIAKIIRDAVLGYLEKEEEEAKEAGKKEPKDFGPYHSQLDAFKKELIGDITSAQFADMYAQTICYGMLAAKYHSESTHKGNISDETASRRIPKTNPFLVKVFDTIAGVDVDEKLGKWINVIAKLLNRANITEILAPKKGAFEGHDPIFYFYENFLAEYDPTLREKRGVYYTPLPVVSFIVRSVDKVLKQDFGLKDGLACDAKIDEQNHKVLILDPATGTGTFLNEVLEHIYSHFKQKGLIGMKWGNDYIQDHILPRLFGFELMMAPYTMAHLKLGINLEEKGYIFNSDKRLEIYLTNTLEEAKEVVTGKELFSRADLKYILANETKESTLIKYDKPIIAVIGNPPYSILSQNLNAYQRKLIERYKYLNGQKIIERGALQFEKNLQDDYVKFIAWSQQRIEKTGYGIVAMITNHGYLDNPTFKGMRKSLIDTFDKLFFLNLHGNANKKDFNPEGSKDENIFDIKQGVSIGIFIKFKEEKEKEIFYSEKYGLRDDKIIDNANIEGKYNYLLTNDILSVNWKKIIPDEPHYLFIPQNNNNLQEYNSFLSIIDILKVYSTGVITARDNVTISGDEKELIKNAETFINDSYSNKEVCEILNISEKKGWDISKARKSLSNNSNVKEHINNILYRPFDIKKILYHDSLVWTMARPVMRHMLAGENLGLAIGKAGQVIGEENWDVLFCTKYITEFNLYRRGGNNLFPLYLYPDPKKPNDNLDEWLAKDGGKAVRRANLSPEVVKGLESMLCARFVSDGKGNITEKQATTTPSPSGRRKEDEGVLKIFKNEPKPPHPNPLLKGEGELLTFGPEDIFNYIYAILHSPTYRTRYAEFLKIDFPRIPFTSGAGLFAKLAVIGEKLVGLHLLEDVGYDGIGFPELGDNKVEKLAYNEQKGEVWINSKQYFSGIAQDVWEFHIGGYQVAQKWLKDRKGRTLTFEDIETYMKAMASIRETIVLMSNIDETIENNGGYPII